MKTKFIFIIVLIFTFLLGISAYSNQDNPYYSINIGGLILEQNYSHEQVVQILGTPDNFEHHVNDPEYEYYDVRIYKYNNNVFHFLNNKFLTFEINSPGLKLNGIVGVGDQTNSISNLPNHKILTSVYSDATFYEVFFRGYNYDVSPILFRIENGLIKKIAFTYQDNV